MNSPVKLPPLPPLDVGVYGQGKFAYSKESMRAYAEQAVREALAEQEMVGKWEQVPFGNYVGIQWKKDYVATAGDELYLKRYSQIQELPCPPTSDSGHPT